MEKYNKTLSQNSNLMDLYMYAAGTSEIPTDWHLWCCMSLVASAVGNRVYYKKFVWEQMSPNMYIFLVGPSGCGKGGAIGFMQQFLHPMMNSYSGSATYKSLVDLMASPAADGCPERSNMLLIQPELSDCIGSGLLANSMVKAMTNWYNPSSQDYQETTRTHGEKTFGPPCINWLAGTTVEWLKQTVDTEAMMSGFFGRVAISPGEYDPNRRIYNPQSPRDFYEVVDYIKDRILWLTRLEGEFEMSAEAYEADKQWYESRPASSPEMLPFWRRQHDLKLKIAMILSLCKSMSLQISTRDILQAEEMTDQVYRIMPKIISQATQTEHSRNVEKVRSIIRRMHNIRHSTLLQKVRPYSIDAEILRRVIYQLKSEDVIIESRNAKGGIIYTWKDGMEGRQMNLPPD